MESNEWIVRHYATGQIVRVSLAEGQVRTVPQPGSGAEPGGWLAPALVDLQVNGYAGVDFQQDDLTLEQLRHAARELRAAGCGRWLLTLITDDWPRLMRRLRRLAGLRSRSPELCQAIAGWHLEGPFLSAEPGYHGAHPAEFMLDPRPAHLRELREVAGQTPVLLTLAPERTGALQAIQLAVSMGIRVSLGHTNAPAEILRAAVEVGATGFTHFGNACPVALDRRDNILWRVADLPGLTRSLIPDTHHVAPALFRAAHRLFDPGSVFYVSDTTSAGGAPPGRFKLGGLVVDVGPDQVVRRPGSGQFAGSALRPLDGVFRAAAMLGEPWQKTWERYSTVPERFMGLPPSGLWCLLEFDGGVEPGSTPRVRMIGSAAV